MEEILILVCCCSIFVCVCSLSASAMSMIKPRGRGTAVAAGGDGPPGCSDPFYEYSSACKNGYKKTKCTDPRRACAKKQHIAVYGREYSKLFGPPGKLTSYQCKKSSYITKMNMFVDEVFEGKPSNGSVYKVVKGIDAMCFDPIYGIEVPLKINTDGGIGQLSGDATAGGVIGGIFADATIGNYWGNGSKNFDTSDPESSYSGIKTVYIWHDAKGINDIDYVTFDNRVFNGGGTKKGKKERFTCPNGTRLVGFEVVHGASKKIDAIRFIADSPLAYRGFT